ncbi:hypothetical protein ACS0TY_034726 [Phlomoides rotata]
MRGRVPKEGEGSCRSPQSCISWHMHPTVIAVDSNSFFKDGRKISVGDSALFKPPQGCPPFVGLIRRLTLSKDNNLSVEVNWLYRPAELQVGKGSLFDVAPNEIFYSFHKDKIPAASLLHPCKVAFLPRGAELPTGTSSFICRRVYDIESKCLWWLTDQDYVDERQEEVDQLLYKTRTEMHGTLPPGGRSPKQANGLNSASQLKSGTENVQNIGTCFPSQAKGKKRERGDHSSDPVKRERLSRTDDGDSAQYKGESNVKSDIARITEKGGLMDIEGVEKLIQLMKPDRVDKKIDMITRSMLTGVIAGTVKVECLNRFVQLRGLPVLDEWLQDIHKGRVGGGNSSKDGDKSVEEFLLILLRALDKLPVNLHALQTCNIGRSVNHLRSHKNVEIHKKARTLVDTWKKRVEAEMIVNDTKSGSSQNASVWSSKSRLPEAYHGGNRTPSGSDVAMKSSITQHSASKTTSVKSSHGESNTKSASSSPGQAKLVSPTVSGKENQAGTSVGGTPDVPQVREDRSSSSNQSHNYCQSNSGKEEGKNSASITAAAVKISGSTRNRKVSGFPGVAGGQKETSCSRNFSTHRSITSDKLSESASERVLQGPPTTEGSNHKLIVKIPNRVQSPTQVVSGVSLEDPSILSSQASQPVLADKDNQFDCNSKEKSDANQCTATSDMNGGSCPINDRKEILTGSVDEAGSPAVLPDGDKITSIEDSRKLVEGPKKNQLKRGKSVESSFSPMNALIESCVKYSEAQSALSLEDDVGMNLLARVATGEMSRSELVSPTDSTERSIPAMEEVCFVGNEIKSKASPEAHLRGSENQFSKDAVGDDKKPAGINGSWSKDGLHVSKKASLSSDINCDTPAGDSSKPYDSASADFRSTTEPMHEVVDKSNQKTDTKEKIKDGETNKENQREKLSSNNSSVENILNCSRYGTNAMTDDKAGKDILDSDRRKLRIELASSNQSYDIDCKADANEGLDIGNNSMPKFTAPVVKSECAKRANNDNPQQTTPGPRLMSEAGNEVKAREGDEEVTMNQIIKVEGDSSDRVVNSSMALEGHSIAGSCSTTDGLKRYKMESASTVVQVSSAASDPDAKVKFDLNEGFPVDDGKFGETASLVSSGLTTVHETNSLQFSVNSIPTARHASITVAAAAKGPFLPPEDLLRSKGKLGWKGSAATSAFRPAESRKFIDMPLTSMNLPDDPFTCKIGRAVLDIDLNIDLNMQDERVLDEMASQDSAFSGGRKTDLVKTRAILLNEGSGSPPVLGSGGLDFDLNSFDEPTESGQCSTNRYRYGEVSVVHVKPFGGLPPTDVQRGFDLNDRPGVDDAVVEHISMNQQVKVGIPSHVPSAGPRSNNPGVGSFSPWFSPGNTYSTVAIPSVISDRADQPFPVIPPGVQQRTFPAGITPFATDVYRGSVLSSSPAVSFPSSPFQFPVFPFGPSYPLPTAAFPIGGTSYADSSSGARLYAPPLNSQLLGPISAIPSQFSRPYVVGLADSSGNSALENSRKWGRQGLDLNAGPGANENEVRGDIYPLSSSQQSGVSSQVQAEEQARMYSVSGSILKRTEPDGGWDKESFRYKQSSWHFSSPSDRRIEAACSFQKQKVLAFGFIQIWGKCKGTSTMRGRGRREGEGSCRSPRSSIIWHMHPTVITADFNSFFKDGRKISVGDCALFKPSQDSPPFIGLIRWLTSSKNNNLQLGVNWLYRPAELKLEKGSPLDGVPNEIFYSSHKEEIPAASLLHPCKVAFLPKGSELLTGTSSFVCWRVYDIEKRCLWWLTDPDYFNVHREEVDQLLYKTKTEMHGTLQPGGRSPKHSNGLSPASQLKPGPENVQNSGTPFTSVKGKKRERGDHSSDPVKRERPSRIDDGDSAQYKAESSVKLDIARITEKGGLVDFEGVEKLVQLMQPDKVEKKLDLSSRSLLAGVVAATEKVECLNRFVQLRGLPVLDEWLQDIHKGKVGGGNNLKDGDKYVEEFLLVVLRALDKLPVNLHALQTCNVGRSVNHLRSHKNGDIHRKARILVDTWKKRVEAEMNSIDAKSGSSQGASVWSSKSRLPEASHGGSRMPSGSDVAMKSSITQHSGSKPSSVRSSHGESNTKSASSSPRPTKPASPPASGKESHGILVVGTSDVPQVREDRSSSSNQSHSYSQSSLGKEEGKSSPSVSATASKITGSTRNRKVGGFPGVTGAQKENSSSKSFSAHRSTADKLSQSAFTSERVPESPTIEVNNQKLIVKIPNLVRSPTQDASVVSLEDPSTVSSQASPQVLSDKLNCLGNNLEKSDTHQCIDTSDMNVDSCQVNDKKDMLTGYGDGARAPAVILVEEKGMSTQDSRRSIERSGTNQSKCGKLQETSFSPMNALIESCAKYSEAHSSFSLEDDVGMNLLASVAAGEMSRSELVSPSDSTERSTPAAEEACFVADEAKSKFSTENHILGSENQFPNKSEDDGKKQAALNGSYSESGLHSPTKDINHGPSHASAEIPAGVSNKSLDSAHTDFRSSADPVWFVNEKSNQKTEMKVKLRDSETKKEVQEEKVPSITSSHYILNCSNDGTNAAVAGDMDSKDLLNTDKGKVKVEVASSNHSFNSDSKSDVNERLDMRTDSIQNVTAAVTESEFAERANEKLQQDAPGLRLKAEGEVKLGEKDETDSKGHVSEAERENFERGVPASVANEGHIKDGLRGSKPGEIKMDEAGSTFTVAVGSSSASASSNPNTKVKFDLNEFFTVDDGKYGEPVASGLTSVQMTNGFQFSATSIPTLYPPSITVAAAAKGPFLPPEDLLRSKGELGWKGSAATSAFRPAEPRKAAEMPLASRNLLDDASTCKSVRPMLDIDLNIDLNVPDERVLEETASRDSTLSFGPTTDLVNNRAMLVNENPGSMPVHGSGGLDFDLNSVDESNENGQCSTSRNRNGESSMAYVKPLGGLPPIDFQRGFDLNDRPGVDDARAEHLAFNQQVKVGIPSHLPSTGLRTNNPGLGTYSSWFSPGNTYSTVAIPSVVPDRADQPFPVIPPGAPQRTFGAAGITPFSSDVYRGSVLPSSPAVSFPSNPFQFPVFPFGPSIPLPSANFPTGAASYVDSSSGARLYTPPVNSHLLGPVGAMPSQYQRSFLVGLPDSSSNNGLENSRKWGRQGLDLNAGPGAIESEAREDFLPFSSSQHPVASSQVQAEEQARMNAVSSNILKRMEPEGGWDKDSFRYKHSPWQ